MAKIKVFFLAYFDAAIIQTSLESLYASSEYVELHVIENKSEHTPIIKPFLLSELAKGNIASYYLFNTNIANNACEIVIDRLLPLFKQDPYFIITDGDIAVNGTNWLHEQLAIMNANEEVFACGVSLDLSNLPLKTFPEAASWVAKDIAVYADYIECRTPCMLLMLRTSDFLNYWKYRATHQMNLTDGTMSKFCYGIIQKKWARTPINSLLHLTWDSYADINHPYTIAKLKKSFKQTWHSKKYYSKVYHYQANGTTKSFIDWKRVLQVQLIHDINLFFKKISLKLFSSAKENSI
jgi:hypothetical protein